MLNAMLMSRKGTRAQHSGGGDGGSEAHLAAVVLTPILAGMILILGVRG